MKKLILLAIFMATVTASAQCGVGCTISGSGTIPSNTNRTYSVPASSGYSYFWSVTGGLSIVGSNTGSSVTVRGTSNGSVYITKFRAGSAPCCASRNITVTSNTCGISISRVYEVNGNQELELAFYVVPTLQSGWSITSSSFSVTFENNTVSNYTGNLNPNGFPQILIPVYCSNRVKRVTANVTASSGLNSCTRTVTTNFQLVCGSAGGIGIGFSVNLEKDQLSVNTNSKETFDISVYDLSGNLKLESKSTKDATFDMSGLPNGIYIVKTKSQKGEVQTKKVILEK